MGGRAIYSIFITSIFFTITISIYRNKKDAFYFALIALLLILFWPLLFSISGWPHWNSPRNFIFLGVVFFFCAASVQLLSKRSWIYLFILAISLPAQMALENFYAFSTQTHTIKSAFKELVGNYEGLLPIIVDAREGNIASWVRLPYGRQEAFIDGHFSVPRFDRVTPMNLCVSKKWGDYEANSELIAQNCQFFNGLSYSNIVSCSVQLPV